MIRTPAQPDAAGLPAENAESCLASNLTAARVAAGLTQQGLASAADVSRATIAQIESGLSDPRLSTVSQLARALGIEPQLLLMSSSQVRAIVAQLGPMLVNERLQAALAADLAEMRALVRSGMLKHRRRAAHLGAQAALAAGCAPSSVVAAGILSAIWPGEGTILGVLLAQRGATSSASSPSGPSGCS